MDCSECVEHLAAILKHTCRTLGILKSETENLKRELEKSSETIRILADFNKEYVSGVFRNFEINIL
jgi:hypothetical protein